MLAQRSTSSLEEKLPASPVRQVMEESAPAKLKYDRWIAMWPKKGAACKDECTSYEYSCLYDPPRISDRYHNTLRSVNWAQNALKVVCCPLVSCDKLTYATEYYANTVNLYPIKYDPSEDECCSNPKQNIPAGCCCTLNILSSCCLECCIGRTITYPIAGFVGAITYSLGSCVDAIAPPSDDKSLDKITEFGNSLRNSNLPEVIRLSNDSVVIRDLIAINYPESRDTPLLAVKYPDVKTVTIQQRKQLLAYMWERGLLFKWDGQTYDSSLIKAAFEAKYTGSDELLDFLLQFRVGNISLPSVLIDSPLRETLTTSQNSLPCNYETYSEYKKKEKILNKYGISITWKAAEPYEQRSSFVIGLFSPRSKPECQLSAIKSEKEPQSLPSVVFHGLKGH